jgi:hypothetical protein
MKINTKCREIFTVNINYLYIFLNYNPFQQNISSSTELSYENRVDQCLIDSDQNIDSVKNKQTPVKRDLTFLVN